MDAVVGRTSPRNSDARQKAMEPASGPCATFAAWIFWLVRLPGARGRTAHQHENRTGRWLARAGVSGWGLQQLGAVPGSRQIQ